MYWFNHVLGNLINYLGGFLRWIYGSTWRTLFKKEKYTFKEYIYGPKKPNYYDKVGHRLNNIIVFFIFFGIVIAFLTN